MRAVYLGGVGLACALGDDLDAALATLRAGGVRPVPVAVSAQARWPVYKLSSTDGGWDERVRRRVRAVVAQADRAGGAVSRDAPLFVASSSLDIGHMEHEKDDRRLGGDLLDFAEIVAGALAWRGPVFTVSTACTSALNAILAASELLRGGGAEEALVLGAEPDNRFTVAGFGAMQLLSPEGARPFGAGRDGLVLGEAFAALQLRTRPARWRIAGGANIVDGSNPAGNEAGAVRAVCEAALAQAGLRPRDIGLVKVQAAGSPGNDAVEAQALRALFDPLPPLVSFKTAIGHTLGASGAAELALLTGCVAHGAWPVATHAPDEALGLALSASAPRGLRHVLFNVLGFGGGHAALVLEDAGEGAP